LKIFSEVLYAALFNSKMSSGKVATSTGGAKQTNPKAIGLILKILLIQKMSFMIM
jgi:hypothetical protein